MRLRGAAGLVLVALALTVAMAAPVLRAPRSRLFGAEIVGRHEAPFIVANQFEHPRPLGLYTQPATDYLGAALAAVTGDGIAALNLLVLATFPLAALFAYLLALRLTGSRPASWLAGLFYAFAPFHIAQAAYHAHGAQIQWLPLYLLALWLCLESAGLRRLLLLGLSLALVALSNFYYGLMAVVLTPFALLGFWAVHRDRGGGGPPGLRRTLLALAALASVGLGYVALFAPAVLDQRQRLAFPRADLALYGARASSYLTPPVGHPLLGPWVEELWLQRGLGGMLEQQITIGFGLMLLAGGAIALYFQGQRRRGLAATPALVILAAAAFIVSLAPADVLGAGGPAGILRPSGIVYGILPMFRAYARFGLIVFLATAILASAGATWLLSAGRRRGRLLGIGLLVVAVVELAPFPPLRWRDVLPTSAHRFLDARDEPIRVLDCMAPARMADQPAFLRFSHQLSLPSSGGDCGDPDFPARLAHAGFTHLLVRRNSPLGGWLAERPAPPGTAAVGRFDDALLFELATPVDPDPFIEFDRGFHWREFLGDESYRWMRTSGELAIVNPGAAAVAVGLDLKLHAFPVARTLTILADGALLARLEVATEPGVYSLPELSIAPGRRSLTLLADAPAVVADSVLGNGDLRELSIALWGWAFRPVEIEYHRSVNVSHR